MDEPRYSYLAGSLGNDTRSLNVHFTHPHRISDHSGQIKDCRHSLESRSHTVLVKKITSNNLDATMPLGRNWARPPCQRSHLVFCFD